MSNRKWLKVAVDAAAVFLGFFVALAIRFEFQIPPEYLAGFFGIIPIVIVLYLLANSLMRMYSGHWKYASFDELLHLSSTAVISTAMLFVAVMSIPDARLLIPVSVAVSGGVLALFAMAFARLQFRLLRERSMRKGEHGGTKVLLVGAGEAGEMVVRDMLRHPEYGFGPVAFVDDNPAKHNLVVLGVPVLGTSRDIPALVRAQGIEEVFITIPSVSGERVKEIATFCDQTDVKVKILPGIVLAMTGDVDVSAIRKLKLEDLLGREPVQTDLASISAYVAGKVVMVTGAGGSIGSELSRQLCCLGPRRLLLLDNDSTRLYELDMDLAGRTPTCSRDVIVADIRDARRLEAVFEAFRPQVLFHSAALKHVPLMEFHPCEAVKSNVKGTRNLAELGCRCGLERFILISTDKAVQPVNVMGATKRVAELVIRHSNGNGTLFTAVRFGNVLGSRGSVVPLFQKQIEGGGPVLVTHPEVSRYFMTVEEAAQLVIQAGAYTEGSDVFILDMGKPVRIADLAHDMVRLLGRDKGIEIRMTGLRPGEKMHEKLVFKVEEMLPTPHSKIGRVNHDSELPPDFGVLVDDLLEAAGREDEDQIRDLLSRLVPGYRHGMRTLEEVPAGPGEKPELKVVN